MRNFTRAGSITLAAVLAVGALALSAPAYADDTPAATQEVASSPDISTPAEPTPLTEPAPTGPGAAATPTTPASEPAESGTPTQPPSDESTPPIESTDSGSSTAPEASSATTPSGGPSSPEANSSPTSDESTSRPIVSDDTTEVFWAMPNGGTPDNVTWPQTLSGADKLECGVWYQVDTYPLDDVAALTADGRLDLGEDYAVVVSWRFVYGGDCPPAPGPANPKASIQSTCGSADVEVENPGDNILTASVVIYVDGAFNQALAVAAGNHQTAHLALPEGGTVTVRTGPAFGDEQLATSDVERCAVVVPPTETPTATPTPSATPAAAPAPLVQKVAAPVITTGELAETGSSERPLVLGIIAGALILLAIILIAIGRGRVHAEHERQQRAKLRK